MSLNLLKSTKKNYEEFRTILLNDIHSLRTQKFNCMGYKLRIVEVESFNMIIVEFSNDEVRFTEYLNIEELFYYLNKVEEYIND